LSGEAFQNGLVDLIEEFHVHEANKPKRGNNLQEILIYVCEKDDLAQRNNKRTIGYFVVVVEIPMVA